ncbi:MAG: tRNA (adenosine(37)-N6)-dimethylallyltransferase MiaA [Planctomycetaceae bacterium]|nr:tRNA (adenosine(37)-N6)-dimethylallyltransferase MiaA [Planctomycetaceae bacterium]
MFRSFRKDLVDSLFPPAVLRKSWFLAGPTACGKTATSLELARRLNAEIISLDSMAIYRGMDIGTAKPGPDERHGIPHHLIDVADPQQDFSVAEFVQMAHAAAVGILSRDRTPLFVGGTGLYLRSILRGIFEGPEADWEFRRLQEQRVQQEGSLVLHEELRRCDPVTAERLHANDVRRVIRALEVFHLTGQPLSQSQTHQPRPAADRPVIVAWLESERDWLHQRINQRVDAMMQAGLLEEVRSLWTMQPAIGRTARQALGYRELFDHFDGVATLPEAVTAIKAGTRQFAKRQHTWFRHLEECVAIPVLADDNASTICDRLVHACEI